MHLNQSGIVRFVFQMVHTVDGLENPSYTSITRSGSITSSRVAVRTAVW